MYKQFKMTIIIVIITIKLPVSVEISINDSNYYNFMIIFCNNYILYGTMYVDKNINCYIINLIVSICKTNIRSRSYFPLSIFSEYYY